MQSGVCVSSCPKIKTVTDCLVNVNVTACPTATYDATDYTGTKGLLCYPLTNTTLQKSEPFQFYFQHLESNYADQFLIPSLVGVFMVLVFNTLLRKLVPNNLVCLSYSNAITLIISFALILFSAPLNFIGALSMSDTYTLFEEKHALFIL